MKIIGFLAGIAAVLFFLLGYLQKKRSNIIAFNLISRVLYIAQYLLVGAFAGAILDVVGALSTLMAQNIHRPIFKKYKGLIFVLNNLVIIGVGLLLYENIFSIFLIIGVTLQTGALWLKDEKQIRALSLICCPFCFTYNFASGAYGSCIGDALALLSVSYSLIKYDYLPSLKEKRQGEK